MTVSPDGTHDVAAWACARPGRRPSLLQSLTCAGGSASYALRTSWRLCCRRWGCVTCEGSGTAAHADGTLRADTLPEADLRTFQLFTDAPDQSFLDWRASQVFQFPFGISGFVDCGGVEG